MNQFCRILQYVDLFLRAASADVAPHVARLLREIFSGGPSLSLKIKESQIASIMDKVFLKNTRSGQATISLEGKAEFVAALQELVTVIML